MSAPVKFEIEIPGIVKDFELVFGDMQTELIKLQKKQRQRNILMYCSLLIAAACLTATVIQCLG